MVSHKLRWVSMKSAWMEAGHAGLRLDHSESRLVRWSPAQGQLPPASGQSPQRWVFSLQIKDNHSCWWTELNCSGRKGIQGLICCRKRWNNEKFCNQMFSSSVLFVCFVVSFKAVFVVPSRQLCQWVAKLFLAPVSQTTTVALMVFVVRWKTWNGEFKFQRGKACR